MVQVCGLGLPFLLVDVVYLNWWLNQLSVEIVVVDSHLWLVQIIKRNIHV